MWTRAVDLKVGMKTGGGLVVAAITTTGPLFNVTWAKDDKRRTPIQYHADQAFDITEEPPMAQKVTIETTSDLSGNGEASTVSFGIDGKSFEIDLTEKEGEQLHKALSKYVAAARSVGKAPRSGVRRAASSGDAKAIREWARSNGHAVPDRGRVPESVREAYAAAH